MKKSVLSRSKTREFVDYLAAAPEDAALTLFIPPRLSPADIAVMLKELPSPADTALQLEKLAVTSANGAVIVWAANDKYLVLPPFPVQEKGIFPGIELEPMRALVSRDYFIGVVLVRLGSYAVGVCRGDKLVSSKVGTGLIHGRHRQGGSSSHRFERHRDKQIESFLIRVAGHIQEQFEPYAKSLDFLVFGGARTTITTAQKYCPWLERLKQPILPPLLDIPEPRKPVLEEAVTRIWSSTLYDLS